jgi:glutathionylspermidine synthase
MGYLMNIIVLMESKGTRFVRKIIIGKCGKNISLEHGLKPLK